MYARLSGVLAAVAVLLGPAAALAQAPPVIAAAGDIACDPTDPSFNGGNGTATNCRMRATSDLLVGKGFDAVLLLGDNQYWDGTLAAHLVSFAPTWGRLGPRCLALTRLLPGILATRPP